MNYRANMRKGAEQKAVDKVEKQHCSKTNSLCTGRYKHALRKAL